MNNDTARQSPVGVKCLVFSLHADSVHHTSPKDSTYRLRMCSGRKNVHAISSVLM